jgi:hypothetical protein
MSRTRVPNVNASLLREIRMAYQLVFGKQELKQSASARSESPMLKCCFCLNVRKNEPSPAITVLNGQAVCHDHMYYVQGGSYTAVLTQIKRDEVKS